MVEKTRRGLLKFIDWLAQAHPLVESWRDVTRDPAMEYANALNTMKSEIHWIKDHCFQPSWNWADVFPSPRRVPVSAICTLPVPGS